MASLTLRFKLLVIFASSLLAISAPSALAIGLSAHGLARVREARRLHVQTPLQAASRPARRSLATSPTTAAVELLDEVAAKATELNARISAVKFGSQDAIHFGGVLTEASLTVKNLDSAASNLADAVRAGPDNLDRQELNEAIAAVGFAQTSANYLEIALEATFHSLADKTVAQLQAAAATLADDIKAVKAVLLELKNLKIERAFSAALATNQNVPSGPAADQHQSLAEVYQAQLTSSNNGGSSNKKKPTPKSKVDVKGRPVGHHPPGVGGKGGKNVGRYEPNKGHHSPGKGGHKSPGKSPAKSPANSPVRGGIRAPSNGYTSIRSAATKADKVVALDGSGDFRKVKDAVNSVPDNSVIYIKAGVYNEMVTIYKKGITLIGDGIDKTIITGSASYSTGYDIITSATIAANGNNFVAMYLTIRNTAGPSGLQAVALRLDSNPAALYQVKVTGYQDTLFSSTGRHYIKNCIIEGSVDFIFGYGAAVVQSSTINVLQSPTWTTTILASGCYDSGALCGLVVIDSKVNGDYGDVYLGRPWKQYAAMVFINTELPSKVNRNGWMPWKVSETFGGKPFLAEYNSKGAGAKSSRVSWARPGVVSSSQVNKYYPNNFISLSSWIGSTGVPV